MKLHELINVLDDGCACFSIPPYCEEYKEGIEKLRNEKWYLKIKNREIGRVVTIGGGSYKVETCIKIV